jgi:hypothetical protein
MVSTAEGEVVRRGEIELLTLFLQACYAMIETCYGGWDSDRWLAWAQMQIEHTA